MKDISKILQKGTLTPKERVRLLANNAMNKERNGKATLTEEEAHVIGEAWNPKDNQEVIEYNKYSRAWKTWVTSELDIKTCYLRGRMSFESLKMILLYFIRYPRIDEIKEALTHLKEMANEKEAGESFHKNIEGIENALVSLALIEKKISGKRTTNDLPLGHNKNFLSERASFLKEYGRLLSFYELNKSLSKVFDLDLTYTNLRFLAQLNKDASLFNASLLIALDSGASYKDEKTLVNENILINTDGINPIDDVSGYYVKEFTGILGDGF